MIPMINEETTVQIKDLVTQIQEKLERINKLLGAKIEVNSEEWYTRRMDILIDIYEKGGIVTDKELQTIASKHSMDTRGLGGYYSKNGSLVKISSDRTALTEKGKQDVEEWLKNHKHESPDN